MELFLNSIRHGTDQQFAADTKRRLRVVERPPLLLKLGDRGRFQESDSLRDRLSRFSKSLVLHVCPASWPVDTHIALVRHRSQSVFTLPFAFPSPSIVQRFSPNERSSLASCAQQSNHPRPAVMAEGDQENGTREIGKR